MILLTSPENAAVLRASILFSLRIDGKVKSWYNKSNF